MTVIINCNCKHEYQDEKYGKGRRVANVTLKDNARCTVCGELRSFSKEKDKD